MGILNDLLARVKSVDEGLSGGAMIRDVVVRHRDDIMELQRVQLLEGKAGNGEDIRPSYSEDVKPGGYFRTVESAGRYAAWKGTISYPYQANRNPDTPNLYVNGKFHSELVVQFGSDVMTIEGGTDYAKRIVSKYGLRTFGLMGEKWNILFEDRGGYPELMSEIKSKLYV